MTSAAPPRMSEAATTATGHRYQTGAIQWPRGQDVNVIPLAVYLGPGTVATPPRVPLPDETSSGPEAGAYVTAAQTTAEALLEIRRRSGLAWESLGKLFSVSRRTVHHWANGKTPSALHEKEIRRTLDAIRHLYEGNQSATRDRLLTVTDGLSPFDLLAGRRYADVLRWPAGAGPAEAEHCRTAISEEERVMRRPPPPDLLLDAAQDRPEIPVGKVRIARPLGRNKKPT